MSKWSKEFKFNIEIDVDVLINIMIIACCIMLLLLICISVDVDMNYYAGSEEDFCTMYYPMVIEIETDGYINYFYVDSHNIVHNKKTPELINGTKCIGVFYSNINKSKQVMENAE